MKASLLSFASILLLFFIFNACSDTEQKISSDPGISAETKAKIKALGYDTDGMIATDGGYIVEGDIFLSEEGLTGSADLKSLIIAQNEQYHTTNLVTGLPRNIKISVGKKMPASVVVATDAAIARYNAQGLLLTFSRIPSANGDIIITPRSLPPGPQGIPTITNSGPPSNGNPGAWIHFNTTYSNWNANTLTTVMAHAIGHCIGFRHTDYMDYSFSCPGVNFSEDDGGYGLIHIPGTPTGPDDASWMLRCIDNGVNRPFNANDLIALNFLY